MANSKFKTKVQADAGVQLTAETANKALKLDASGNVGASVTSDVELGYLSGVTSSVQTQLGTNSTAISDHIADTVDAHDASAISSVASGNLAATDVQSALDELQTDIDTRATSTALSDHINDVTDAHDASAISNVASGNLAATDVQGALNELQSDIDTRATVSYVDSTIQGLKPKAAVRVATLVAGTLATSFENGDTIDGIVLATGNRILIKNQASALENGIYVVQATGAPVRATDFDSVSPTDEINGAYTMVQEGTQSGQGWVQQGTVTIVGTDAINFVIFSNQSSLVITSSQVSDFSEAAQDAVGTILVDSSTIDFTYTDATPSISAAVISQMSITADASGVKLVNDELAPGNTKYYGTNGSGTKGFFAIPAVGSAGDIQETSFSAADNQAAPANVTGFAFANGVVRSFEAQVSVFLDATADSYEKFHLEGIQKGAEWDMSVTAVGDDSGVVFTITTSGQIQYQSPLSAGFVSNTMRFRALTLSV